MLSKALILCGLILGSSVASGAGVTIVVNHGPFESVQKAAYGEDQVNFFDMDLSDERAATECYAAVELRAFVAKVSEAQELEIQFASPTELPTEGDVFILGSKGSNQLIPQKSDVPFESEQAYRIRAIADNGRTVTTIEGGDRAGTLYGVYRYLEHLDIRFIGLGETGTVLPSKPIEIPQNLDISEGSRCRLLRGSNA